MALLGSWVPLGTSSGQAVHVGPAAAALQGIFPECLIVSSAPISSVGTVSHDCFQRDKT